MTVMQEAGKSGLQRRLDDLIGGERRICLIALGIAMVSFQTGYDVVVMSGFQGMPGFLSVYGYKDPSSPLGYNLSTHVQTLIQSLVTMGSLFASIFVFLVGSRVSRRTALWAACALCIIAVSIQIASTNLSALYVGRLLLGFSNGICTPYISIYITESAPAFLIGSLLTVVVMVSNIGGLIGVIVNNYTSKRLDKLSYQIPMALIYFSPVLVGCLLFFLPDTPRYYIIKGQYEKATDAIRRLRGITDEDVLREEVEKMKNAYVTEREAKGKVRFYDIFKGVDLRRTLLLYGLSCGQIITGRGFLSQYSVYFLGQAGITNPFHWVMITYVVSLTGNLVATFFLRYLPRKTIYISGLVVMSAAMFVMAIPSTVHGGSVGAGRVVVAMYIIHTWTGSATTTPSAACIASEIASQRLRPEMGGTANLILWGTSWLIAYTTPYFINPEQLNWGAKYAYIWGSSCAILAVWVWAFVPETIGRSLEQIDELFKKRVPARKFRDFAVETENVNEHCSRQKDSRKEDGARSVTHVAEPAVELKS